MVIKIVVLLQELIVTAAPFSVTKLPPCRLPNPLPLIATWLPIDPVVAEMLVMIGDGAALEEVETLSNVTVAKAVVVWLETAKPTYTFWAMVMVCVVPLCVQLIPSADL